MTTGPRAADDAPRIPTAPPRRRPTMKDIAERAGVSPSAVSFALNDRDGVSPATRARIREVAEELGWQPNSAARALSGERSGCVGLVLARPARTLGVESFFLQLVSGIQEALAARRVALLFQVVEDLDAECTTYRRWWAERRVDGVLVVDPRTEDPRPALLASLTLPTVVIGDTQPAPTASKAPGSVPDSVSEVSPGPAPGLGTSPGVSQDPAPVLGTSPGPALIPGANPNPTPISSVSPNPGASPDATPDPGATSGPAPIPDANPGPAPIPGTSPALAPVPGISPSPALIPGTSPDPTPVPDASPSPAPVPGASPAPMPVPDASPSPAPVPGASPAPMPVPDASPDATPVPDANPSFAPVPGASPDPTSIPSTSPGSSPDPAPDLAPVPNLGFAPSPDRISVSAPSGLTPIPASAPSLGRAPAAAPSPGSTPGPSHNLTTPGPLPDPSPDRGSAPATSGLTPSPSPNRGPAPDPDPRPGPVSSPTTSTVTCQEPPPDSGHPSASSSTPTSAPATALALAPTSPLAPPSPSPSSPLSTIWADDAAAMRSIIDHLHALGHRRIVHIAGLPGLAHTDRRVAALRAEAARLGMDAADVRSVCTDYSDEQGAEATRRLLAAPRPPTAIVYDNDVMAVAGAAVAAGLGVPVPGALSIVAWDDSPLCRVTHPRLTSLVRDTAGFGRLAAQELLSLLDGAPTRRLQAELPHLELRESTTRAP